MGKIFYLMGKSSSGKDTIYRKLMKDKRVNLSKIIPYTTRPIREGEKEGVQYHFTNMEGFNSLLESGKVIEYRVYDTFHGKWIYYTVADDSIDLKHNDYLIIGTPQSYDATKKYFGNDKVLPILINVDDGVRLTRALNREKKQEKPKYEEMCRRFLADAEDFSEENLKKSGIEKVFNNEILESCIEEVVKYILDNV